MIIIYFKKVGYVEAGEMALWVRATADLPRVKFIPPIGWLTTVCNSNFKAFSTLSGLCGLHV